MPSLVVFVGQLLCWLLVWNEVCLPPQCYSHLHLAGAGISQFWNKRKSFIKLTYFVPTAWLTSCLFVWNLGLLTKQATLCCFGSRPRVLRVNRCQTTLDIYPDSSGSSPAVKISTGPQDTDRVPILLLWIRGFIRLVRHPGRTSCGGCASKSGLVSTPAVFFREHPMLSRFTLVFCFADF